MFLKNISIPKLSKLSFGNNSTRVNDVERLGKERAQLKQKVKKQAQSAQKEKKWADACRDWEQVTTIDPNDPSAWIQFGNMLNELADYHAAIKVFRHAYKIDPTNPDIPAGIAGVYERMGEWNKSAAYWQDAVQIIQEHRKEGWNYSKNLMHAYKHAIMAAWNAGNRDKTSDLLLRATVEIPSFSADKTLYRLRASMLRTDDPGRAKVFLRDFIKEHPNDSGAAFEYASICLNDCSYQQGLDAIERFISTKSAKGDFLWLAVDLNERLNRWNIAKALCQRGIECSPQEERFYTRLFTLNRIARDTSGCRSIALLYNKVFHSNKLIHDLVDVYQCNELGNRARLLLRWILKHDSDNRDLQLRYINIVSKTVSLNEADRLLRRYIERYGHENFEINPLYCDIAFNSANFMEAKRRLEFYLKKFPDHEAQQVMLGYAIANAVGIDEAENYFVQIATENYQTKGPLFGYVHMAMRRRDRHAINERWERIVTIYPDDTNARVEWARSTYELRHYNKACTICEEQMRRMPTDVTISEFYAWLLVAIGRLKDGLSFLERFKKSFGMTWTTIELSIQAASQLGMFNGSQKELFASFPTTTSPEDSRRFYHVVRQLYAANRMDLLGAAVQHINFSPALLAWLWPYLNKTNTKPAISELNYQCIEKIKDAWSVRRSLVRDDIVLRVSHASNEDVQKIVERPKREQPVIHIINKFEQVSGGSELHALDIAKHLSEYTTVHLWAPEAPHPDFNKKHNVRTIEPSQGNVPQGGVIAVIGVYFDVSSWIGLSSPERVIFLYNTFESPLMFKRIDEVYAKTDVKSEILFCSDMMGEEIGLPGFFEPSPIDIKKFAPAKENKKSSESFVVGRHSRDVIEKHHHEDWRIYAAAAEEGGTTRLLGGTCMKGFFPENQSIDYLPAQSHGVAEFLQELDCYVYRTSTWIEPWGRVVTEAMACGLPVIVSRTGGYAQIIEHDQNGLLFDTTEEAEQLIRELARDPERRDRLGREARNTIDNLLSKAAMQRLAAFYLCQ